MARPAPIVWFERLYLAAFVLRLAVNLANWRIVYAAGLEIGVVVTLLPWFGVMYRHSRVSAVIVGLLFAAGLVPALLWLSGDPARLPSGVGYLVSVLLQGASVACLTHPRARPWFARRPAG